MKKLLMVCVVAGLGAYGWHHRAQRLAAEPVAQPAGLPEQVPAEMPMERSEPVAFQCDGRVYCREMKSCEEASFFVRNCPGVKMDGDHDGMPCEDWCGH